MRNCGFKYFSRDTSVPKQSSSLTQNEKEVVSDFVSKAEKEAQRMGVTCVHREKAIPLTKTSDFLMKPHNIIPANNYPPYDW